MIRGMFEPRSGFVLELIPDDPSVNVHLFLFLLLGWRQRGRETGPLGGKGFWACYLLVTPVHVLEATGTEG